MRLWKRIFEASSSFVSIVDMTKNDENLLPISSGTDNFWSVNLSWSKLYDIQSQLCAECLLKDTQVDDAEKTQQACLACCVDLLD